MKYILILSIPVTKGVNLKEVEAEEFLLLAPLASRASFMGMGVCITHDPLAQRNLLPGLVFYYPL